MFDPTKIEAIGCLQQIERVKMNTMVDRIFVLPWKLNIEQSMVWGGDKTSGLSLSCGDFHNVCFDQNCGYWLIAADRTRQDDHMCLSDFFLTLNI